jgi:hypothetical protein
MIDIVLYLTTKYPKTALTECRKRIKEELQRSNDLLAEEYGKAAQYLVDTGWKDEHEVTEGCG